ncbi:hypothetical protein [Mycobacterium sp.]|uniref:hypothetical protein n=1 Tax=Mycobacterium sp. TaxID=1785 RepID=UPI003C75CD57
MLPDISKAYQLLGQVQADVDRANTAAAQKSTEAYQKAKAEIDQLRQKLVRNQVLDLRYAMFGICMIAIGIALSYCA